MGFFNRLFGKAEDQVQPEAAAAAPEPAPPFPYELLRVRGAEAVVQAMQWRQEWRGSFTPVILGTTKDFTLLTDVFEDVETTPEEFIKKAREVNLPAWFAKRGEGDGDEMEDLIDPSAWTTVPSAPLEFTVVKDILTQKVHPWVWVAKIPTAQPCEVPAFLKMGGWNACPSTEEHVAVWRYWQEKYGAEILCISGDVMEATVSRPPVEKEDCYALAREQFAFCDDLVTQGMGSIDALASALRGSKGWYFWWD